MSEYNVSPAMVNEIATRMSTINNDLKDVLINSKEKVKSLTVDWEGKAAEATIEGFCGYMEKFSDSYYKMINQFVLFLKNNVAAGAVEVENANTIGR